ncbi:reducing hydrogenase subunit alpha [Corynebacterium sp. TAE3-ERU30]|uniref:reducing hydrogenase subunit alpha n=1 Tax=Corynebacterium sp. TAE3-ERU30 TaxID=2849496 RepID=UPI001C47E585|nr:reducing hydrogenase subunit alpha [Corynebacterium sp. TAE3-ERU30]MBV7281980.1 reducing hydrogenase subunit alpha [Corynebacterium sp. TAE3-ERU30]
MSNSSTSIRLDAIIDPFEATVLYTRDRDGRIVDAHFDLSGLPRLEPLLLGKPVAEVVHMVTHLCGLCPVAHHLAGMAALDRMHGVSALPATARAVRELLLHGAALSAYAPKFLSVSPQSARALKERGDALMAAAGATGHFPRVATPGGVVAPADRAAVEALDLEVEQLCAELLECGAAESPVPPWQGVDMHLGADPVGDRIVLSSGESFAAAESAERIRETRPGDPAPRPQVRLSSGQWQPYRVGPVAHADAATAERGLTAVMVAEIRRRVAAVERLRSGDELYGADIQAELQPRAGTFTGVVDGPRGLLAHTYTVDEQQRVVQCRILTPTAQNEYWLAQMMRHALVQDCDVEESIRTADPCLPCAAAPQGQMGLRLREDTVSAASAEEED